MIQGIPHISMKCGTTEELTMTNEFNTRKILLIIIYAVTFLMGFGSYKAHNKYISRG